MSRNKNLEWALAYAEKCGIPVFPVHTAHDHKCDCDDGEKCHSPGKHPHTEKGFKDASTDPAQIRWWWQRWPDANIAAPTGPASLHWVLDVDLPDGEQSLAELIDKHGTLPDTAISITGSGGRQYFFQYPSDQVIHNTAKAIAKDLDVRGDGGYVVLPCSMHVSGRRYEWVKGHDLWHRMLVEAPEWLVKAAVEASKKSAESHTNGQEALGGSIPKGKRNDTLYRLARSMRAKRLGQAAVEAALLAENRVACHPPADDDEVRKIVNNAFKQPDRADFVAQAQNEEKELLSVGDPMEIARKWGAEMIERPDGRTLHRWDQLFWQWSGAHYRSVIDEDIRAELWRYMRDRAILIDAKARAVRPNQKIVADVMSALEGHINLPRHQVSPPCWIGGSPLEKDSALVPLANGLLDLKTKTLHPCSPNFLNLHHAAAEYDPMAVAPTWMDFLDTIWGGEPEQVETLQEIFGYLLAERMDQQKIFMFIGPPRSGKGTIANTAEALLGEDAVARPTSSHFGDGFGNEALIGRSLAIISDARFDAKTNDAVVEVLLTVSGQDSIDVSRKYRTDWRGKLRTRFMILSNELPRLWDSSGAISSRFIVLMTRISFLGKEDFTLGERIKEELSGVLNWAIVGWDRLVKRGFFKQPAEANELVDQFKNLSAPLTEYVAEHCIIDAEAVCDLGDLYKDYLSWCEQEHNKYPLAKNVFARDLRANQTGLVYQRKTLSDGRKISRIGGLRLRFELPKDENASFGDKENRF